MLDEPRQFNPLYLHSAVGLGKTHLLHAIAWEVKRRTPKAQVLYLTAERFRYQFVEAIKPGRPWPSRRSSAQIDILLDRRSGVHAGREDRAGVRAHHQFAARRRPAGGGGLGPAAGTARPAQRPHALAHAARSDHRDRRARRGAAAARSWRSAPRRSAPPIPPSASPATCVKLLADRLTESGRELEGAINRLYLTWQLMRARHARHRRDDHPRSRAGHRAAAHQDRGHPAHRLAALCRVQGRTSCPIAGIARSCGRGRSACISPSS